MARCEKWDDILAYTKPSENTPVTLSFWHYARALTHIAKRDMDAARKEREEFAAARMKVPPDAMLNTNRAKDLLDIATFVLDARLASVSRNSTLALAEWNKAIEIQDRLIYDEPPAWYYPVRESLGGEYLRLKQYAPAEKVFRRDLEINPNNPRALFGLREALRGQSKNAEAEEAQRRFEQEWAGAELQITVGTL